MSMDERVKRLGELVEQCKTLHAEYKHLISRGAAVAKSMGDALAEARDLVTPRHHWSKWLATELDMTAGTAHRYICIAKQWDAITSHSLFPRLNVKQMSDIARGRPPRTRTYTMREASLDVLFDILDERLVAAIGDVPEVEKLIDAIDEMRPTLEHHGLLQSQVEARKKKLRQTRRVSDNPQLRPVG